MNMKSMCTSVLAIFLAWYEPNFAFAQGCLGMDGVSGIGGGVLKFQNGNVCANLDVPGSPTNGAIIQVLATNVFAGDVLEYRILWNDGSAFTPWTVVPLVGNGVHQVNSDPHLFPATNTSCEYTPSTFIRVIPGGVGPPIVCSPGTFGINPVFYRWNQEGGSNSASSAFIVTSVASTGVAGGLTEVEVLPGAETVVSFQDLSNFNCNTFPGDVTVASNRNNTRRWRQFEYGGAGDLNSITGGVTVGSVHVAEGTSLEGPLLTYTPLAGAPPGVAGGLDNPFTDSSFGLGLNPEPNTTDAITIPSTAQLGEVFVVTTHFWNGCNRADQANAPVDHSLTRITVGNVVTSINDSGERRRGRAKVYPNPVTHRFSVSTSGSNGISGLRLYDLTGMVVLESYYVEGDGSFDIHHIPPGVYVLELRRQNGTTEHTKLSKI